MTCDLSVVVVSWNACASLLPCLESIYAEFAATPELVAEVFVVDNGSADGTPNAVRSAFPGVRLIEAGTNLGFARANNIALREASGRYVLLLNPDTRLLPGALAALRAAMEAAPDAGICATLLYNSDTTLQPSWARFPGIREEWTGSLERSQAPSPLPAVPFPVDWAGGACLLVRAEAIAEAGMLDEDFFLYGEDAEWCYRMQRHGWKTLIVPQAGAIHQGGHSAAQVPAAETRRRLFRARLRLYVALYGRMGALLPSAIAAARYGMGSLLRWRRSPPRPQ